MTPRLPIGERSGASFPRKEKRRHLVLLLEDNAAARSPVERQADASSSCGKTSHRLVPVRYVSAGLTARYRVVPCVSPCRETRHRLVPLIQGGTDRNGEP
ncbi:hypothetical protein BHM03_00057939 [Ensete ventricosum]|nr:hypothetical protein BHM03_00057939 [Ensete ventricosum]